MIKHASFQLYSFTPWQSYFENLTTDSKFINSYWMYSIKKLLSETSQYSQKTTSVGVSFSRTYFDKHPATAASENVFMKLRKIKNCSYRIVTYIKKPRFFNINICIKMFVFISWLVSFGVCIHMQYFSNVVRNQLQTVNRVNQKKIKSSRKEHFRWTCFEFWPMKNMFRKIWTNESLIMACLQIYRE